MPEKTLKTLSTVDSTEALREDAEKLVQHYNAWLAAYQRVYKDGVRDPSVPYELVGSKGFPFPGYAEQSLLQRYETRRKR